MHPTTVRKLRNVDFQRRVRMTNEDLPEITQAVLNMLERMRSVRQIADANDVQAVKLMEQRYEEGAVVWTETHETVGREKGAPFVVVKEGKVLLANFHAQTREWQFDRQLRGEVVPYVRFDGHQLRQHLERNMNSLHSRVVGRRSPTV